ncbi:MAG: HNH endonuclease family protein [Cytophagales bacterium]|nr:HNH endonuclease family protein [Cytophagales bacterium]
MYYLGGVQKVPADYLLKDRFTESKAHNGDIKFENIDEYVRDLQKAMVTHHYIYHPPKNNPYQVDGQSWLNEEVAKWLIKLNRLGIRHAVPVIMAVALRRMNGEETSDMVRLLRDIERCNFLVFLMMNKITHTGRSYMHNCAYSYYHPLERGEELKDPEALAKGIRKNVADRWFHEKVSREQFRGDFYNEMKNLNYFLYEYEIHLEEGAYGAKKITEKEALERDKNVSVEHIYPQTGTDEYWQQRFGHLNDTDKKTYLHNLGNLLLVKKSTNSELGKKAFTLKKKRYVDGSQSEVKVSKYDDWTPETIKERGLKMLEFLEKRWGIEIKNQEKFLYLHPKEDEPSN